MMDTLGLYFSIPFCRSKCTYCNFASGVFPLEWMGPYIERLTGDLRQAHRLAEQHGLVLPRLVDTVYLGGGTPSLLPPELLERLFKTIRAEFAVTPAAEITVECAPGQIEPGALDAMLACGLNRISFGVQTFNDREAQASGRLHTRDIALADIGRIRKAGIESVNVDLIAGLAHQTAASWTESLHILAESGADHASVYMLEIDEDSRLGREALSLGQRYSAALLPSDDDSADYYERAVEFLAGRGFAQYEISNFARLGRESRHNIRYWQRAPYLGFGVDAHSMLRTPSGAAVRFASTSELQPYLDSSGPVEVNRLTVQEELEEAFFLGLRMNEGVDLDAAAREFGDEALAVHSATIGELIADGLLLRDRNRIRLTPRGRLISNDVFARFLAQEEAFVL